MRQVFNLPVEGMKAVDETVEGDAVASNNKFLPSPDFLEPKVVNNRHITAPELRVFFEVYSEMFTRMGRSEADGSGDGKGGGFPKVIVPQNTTWISYVSCLLNILTLRIYYGEIF